MQFAAPRDESLGGKLLFAGELNRQGRALLVAGNIAGAASLAATADASAQKQAIRDGAADFLVTNLDEALRILKNEIRKRQPVSVAVSIAPEAIVREMLDRGVLPDLLPSQPQSAPLESAFATFIAQGAQRIAAPPSRPASRFLIWQIPEEFAQRPAAFDALLAEHISPPTRNTPLAAPLPALPRPAIPPPPLAHVRRRNRIQIDRCIGNPAPDHSNCVCPIHARSLRMSGIPRPSTEELF